MKPRQFDAEKARAEQQKRDKMKEKLWGLSRAEQAALAKQHGYRVVYPNERTPEWQQTRLDGR